MVARTKTPAAVLTAVALAVVSLACVVSCWSPQAAMPPCHHHQTNSCGPLLLTAEAPHSSLTTAILPVFSPSLAAAAPASQLDADSVAPLAPEPPVSPPALAPPAHFILRI